MSANHELAEPQPASTPYNDWRQVQVPDAATFTPTRPVSVIVPYYQVPDALALTLAALERQTYPRELFEVVIVDDGSRPALAPPAGSPLDIRVLHQEDRGFGAARARNSGARAAAHEILVFLDADMIAEADLLAAHARWHHVVADALTLGFYACVSAHGIDAATIRDRSGRVGEALGDRDADPPWIERHMTRTDGFTSRHDDLFRALGSGNFGIRKAFHAALGGFDESFTRYGLEDTEFGYRAYNSGALFIPVRDAFGWHQGRWAEGRDAKQRNFELQRAKAGDLIAHPGFRCTVPGRTYPVPQYIVTVEVSNEPLEQIVQAAERTLAGTADLVVRIDISARDRPGDIVRLSERFGSDPRLRVAPCRGPLEEFAASPFHISLPAGAEPGEGFVERLHGRLGTAVLATAVLGDGARLQIARAWALHRARRTGKDISEFGDTRALSLKAGAFAGLRAFRPGAWRSIGIAHRLLATPLGRVIEEAKHIRNARTAWRFLGWLVGAARWWLQTGRAAGRTRPRRPAG